MIRLENVSRPGRMVTVNLPHAHHCQHACQCKTTTIRTVELNPKTGVKGVREISRKLSGSLSLLAGEISKPLPDAVRFAPEVASAIRVGKLAVRQESQPAPAAESAPADPTPAPAS